MSGLEPWPLGGANVFVPIRDENSGRQHTNRLDAIQARSEWLNDGANHGIDHHREEVYRDTHVEHDVPALIAAVEAVSLHVPEADTTGNVYCVVRGADYYTDCPTFKSGDTWPDHIANVVARALGEES